MTYVTVARRRLLARKGKMACPKQRKYVLDTCKRARAAWGYYNRKDTVKCKGGKRKILNKLKKCGIKVSHR